MRVGDQVWLIKRRRCAIIIDINESEDWIEVFWTEPNGTRKGMYVDKEGVELLETDDEGDEDDQLDQPIQPIEEQKTEKQNENSWQIFAIVFVGLLVVMLSFYNYVSQKVKLISRFY
jgi:hypothetical protein